jgi:hypothetical protein
MKKKKKKNKKMDIGRSLDLCKNVKSKCPKNPISFCATTGP